MLLLYLVVVIVVVALLPLTLISLNCDNAQHDHRMHFRLIHYQQRSVLPFVNLQNVFTLEDCMAAARNSYGMALNYAPFGTRIRQTAKTLVTPNEVLDFQRKRNRSRLTYWQQPEEFFNCHVLQCPENITQRTLVHDSRFDYYSAYAHISEEDVCVPRVGIFRIHATPVTYLNASLTCKSNNVTSTLAHIVSEQRTNSLSQLLMTYKPTNKNVYNITNIPLAYVGLHHDPARNKAHIEFLNEEMEPLNCFLYRAWATNHPKDDVYCVALSRSRSWLSVDCNKKLPFICEIFLY